MDVTSLNNAQPHTHISIVLHAHIQSVFGSKAKAQKLLTEMKRPSIREKESVEGRPKKTQRPPSIGCVYTVACVVFLSVSMDVYAWK
jgi:hypothetical protein